eukprot:6132413-Amphidinium_carterae.1
MKRANSAPEIVINCRSLPKQIVLRQHHVTMSERRTIAMNVPVQQHCRKHDLAAIVKHCGWHVAALLSISSFWCHLVQMVGALHVLPRTTAITTLGSTSASPMKVVAGSVAQKHID